MLLSHQNWLCNTEYILVIFDIQSSGFFGHLVFYLFSRSVIYSVLCIRSNGPAHFVLFHPTAESKVDWQLSLYRDFFAKTITQPFATKWLPCFSVLLFGWICVVCFSLQYVHTSLFMCTNMVYGRKTFGQKNLLGWIVRWMFSIKWIYYGVGIKEMRYSNYLYLCLPGIQLGFNHDTKLIVSSIHRVLLHSK